MGSLSKLNLQRREFPKEALDEVEDEVQLCFILNKLLCDILALVLYSELAVEWPDLAKSFVAVDGHNRGRMVSRISFCLLGVSW